mmetsp:Transcript_22720/g.47884  ORF Transcript_22720/g.47884 Transcript_22720/m.47884 type:complete len:271 (+) Transcript_22720:3-815(+)
MSEERFSTMLNTFNSEGEKFFTILKRVLAQHRVVVAVGYKRYHEYITSLYNQRHKYKGGEGNLKMFVDWYRNKFLGGDVFSNQIYKELKKHFEEVQVINFYSPSTRDLMTNIYCNVLPNALHSCTWHIERRRKLPATANPSVEVWPTDIALAAMRNGLLPKEYSEAVATKNDETLLAKIEVLSEKIEAFAKEINYTLPWECISQSEQENILNLSLHYEEDLLPYLFHSQNGESDIRKSFSNFVQKNKFCSVDTASVIQDEKWRAFLSQSN